MEAFGIFGFMMGMTASMFAGMAYSQVAGLRVGMLHLVAEVAQLKAELQRGRGPAEPDAAADGGG